MEVKNHALNENQNKRCNHPLLPKGIRELIKVSLDVEKLHC